MWVFLLLTHIALQSKLILMQKENVTTTLESFTDSPKFCRPRNRLITTEKADLYEVIDATLGEKIILQCHYCEENDDLRAKVWFQIGNLGVTEGQEVKLDMNNNNSLNRVFINEKHSLIINDFNEQDIGLYYCIEYEEQNNHDKFNYLVDLVSSLDVDAFESGNFSEWTKYFEMYFHPINTRLENTNVNGTEIEYIHNKLNLNLELISQWEEWGACDVCGRPLGEAIRKKKGYCRLKITIRNPNITTTANFTYDEIFLKNANEISCRSVLLQRVVPELGNSTRIIPHFVQIQPCDGVCGPDAEGANSGWKVGKAIGYKYRKTAVLVENSYLTVVCPESSLENEVLWRKNGLVIKAGESVAPPEDAKGVPRTMVDTFNTLYLMKVQDSEAGNYTCQVDDIKMQNLKVFVASKRKVLTSALARHMAYLSFVLSLTIFCYFGGVIIACSRRHNFKGYNQLKEESKSDSEEEDLV